jgi:hypothetical protein
MARRAASIDVRWLASVSRDAFQVPGELPGAGAEAYLLLEVRREETSRTLDVHRVRDERAEAAADG